MRLWPAHRPATAQRGYNPWSFYGYSGRPPGPSEADAALFRAIPGSDKVECVVCGATGYPTIPGRECRWQRPHRRGHRPCLDCGRLLTVRLDGSARSHTRCPKAVAA